MSTVPYRGSRGRPWPIVAIALVVVAFVGVAIVGSFIWRPAVTPGSYPSFFPSGFFWIWPFFALLFVFLVARWFFWGWGWEWRGGYGYHSDAMQILEERYARGEITEEQFEQMRKDLGQDRVDS